jgi:hypothetical protein
MSLEERRPLTVRLVSDKLTDKLAISVSGKTMLSSTFMCVRRLLLLSEFLVGHRI